MLQGIYTSASGMLAYDTIQEVIANNLANAATPGFKQDFATFHTASDDPHPQDRRFFNPLFTFKSYTNFDLGALKETTNPLDVAFADGGDNFFVVQAPQGVRYTRAGNFNLDENKVLVNSQNYPVLGANGPIVVGDAQHIQINEKGDVYVDDQLVDRLRVIRFDRVNGKIPLQKDGYTLLKPIGDNATPRNSDDVWVRQGFLEGSNVNMMMEMARMVEITRGFEAYQRAIQVSDATLNTLIHRVGGAS